MKLVFTLLAALSCACAGTADVLPQVGSALQHVRNGYNAADAVESRAATIAAAVCAPDVVPPAFVAECASLTADLSEADNLKAVARHEINAAIEVYEAVNQAAGGE